MDVFRCQLYNTGTSMSFAYTCTKQLMLRTLLPWLPAAQSRPQALDTEGDIPLKCACLSWGLWSPNHSFLFLCRLWFHYHLTLMKQMSTLSKSCLRFSTLVFQLRLFHFVLKCSYPYIQLPTWHLLLDIYEALPKPNSYFPP